MATIDERIEKLEEKMKEKNIDLNTISEITGLSMKEIEDL